MITLVLKETLPKHNPAHDHIFRLQKQCCIYCNKKIEGEDKTQDHVFPRCQGFTIVGNLAFACYACNQAKGSRSPTVDELLKVYYTVYIKFPKRFIGAVRYGKPVIRIN